MQKLDLNKPLCQLNGTPIPNLIMAEQLADGLSNQFKSQNPRKVWGWCQELYKTKFLTLDSSDIDLLISEINSAQGFSVMLTGQLLEEIAKLKKV